MKDELNTDRLDNLALDIIEEGENISEAHIALLKDNAQLRRRCRELMECRAFMQVTGRQTDVERLLREFHRSHDARPASLRKITLVVIAAAALFTGAFFFLHYRQDAVTADTMPTTLAQWDRQDSRPVSARRQVSAPAAATQDISLSDYRKALTEDADVETRVADVPKGQSSCVSLPDGSKVYLHPGSSLRYPEQFYGNKRYVILDGEAYFQVVRNRTKPFIVQSGNITTTVLGTEFNIKGNEVTLITGSVRVENMKSQAALTIKPGEQATTDGDGFRTDGVDTTPYIYWRDGYLYYDNTTIADIVKGIGEIYNMPVTFHNSAAIHQRLRFITERDKGIDAALERLNSMQKVHVYRKDGRIIVE